MLRILFMLIVLILLSLPFLPIKLPFTFFWFNFPEEKRPKNIIYIAGTLLVILLTVILMPYVLQFANWFKDLGFIQWLLSLVPNHALYSATIFEAFFANLLFCLVVLLVHWITGTLFGLFPKFSLKALKDAIAQAIAKAKAKKAKKNGQTTPQQTQPAGPQGLPQNLYPQPEPKDFTSRVHLTGTAGKTTTTKQTANQNQNQTQQTTPSDNGFSFKRLLRELFSLFYVRVEGVWYVQPQCKKVAKHLRNFLILAGIAYLVIFTLLMIPIFFKVQQYADDFYQLMSKLVENCYLYPAVSLVLLTEIFWFMNGKLPDEPVTQITHSSAAQNSRIVDLDQVEQDLIQTFGEGYEVKSFYSGDVEGQEWSRRTVETAGDTVLQTVLSFVESQKLVRNDDYLRGIQELQAGRDTLFDAPLFTAVSMYLYPYLNIRISQGERLVVICQKDSDIPGIIENLREGFRRVQHTHSCLWNITDRRELQLNNQTDILVLTPRDFLDEQLFTEAADFFKRVTIAMLPDADQVVMSNNYLCIVIAERLRQAIQTEKRSRFIPRKEKDIQYLFLSTRHTLNLARSLTEYFMLDKEVGNIHAEYAYGNIRLYVWRSTGESKHTLDNSAQTVKLEASIAQIASEHHIPNVTMFTDVAIFPSQIDPEWLNTYDVFDRPIGFTIVSDDSYNLPGTIYTYSRYIGKQASVLHVISKPYMLRDYFYDTAIRSLYERPLMERGMVNHAQMKHTCSVLLLCRLIQGIPVVEFASKMAQVTGKVTPGPYTYPVIRKLVDQCLTMAFGTESTAEQYGFRLFENLDYGFKRVPYIQIQEEGLLDHLMQDTQLAKVHIISNHETKTLPLFRRMLAQKYLPGQHMVIDHSYYHILSIDYEAGVIEATAASAVHNVPDQYVQVRNYTLKQADSFLEACEKYGKDAQYKAPENLTCATVGIEGNSELTGLTMIRSLGSVDLDSHTVAFYDSTNCPGQLNLANGTVFSVRTDLHRDVHNALYLRFEGNFSGNDSLSMTLAVLLQEMMKTLFPDQHFCLSVCPILRKPESIYEHSDDMSRRIAQMYPRLIGWKKPVSNAMELLIVDDCQGGTGVLDILFEPRAVYLSNILDMLCDYLDWLQKHPENAYLNFGAEQTPVLYQLDRVRELLSAFAMGYRREHDLFQKLHMGDNCCKFCGQDLKDETFVWKDKYNMCKECKNELVPDEAQAGLILEHIRGFLDRRFGVQIPDVTVAFDDQMDISGLDVSGKRILLEPELPLTAVHCEILTQIVRLWQLQNLKMTGEPEFEGQLLYVLTQYLEELEQHQHRKRLHCRGLLGTDDRSVGYCRLRQALQALASDNSFSYMLEHFTGKGKPPVIPPAPTPKRTTRVTDPKKLKYLFRDGLTEGEKLFYDTLLQGLLDRMEVIDLSAAKQSESSGHNLWTCVLQDHPELHWVNPYHYGFGLSTDSPPLMTRISPQYWVDSQEQQKRQAEIDEVLPQYLAGITDETGDYEAALQIYMNMARQMDYDSLALDRQDARASNGKREEGPDDLRNIYGALVLKRPVCAGYAYAYAYLLQQVGIQSVKVSGDCHSGERHAWNVVLLEGNYYHVDVTWGDGSNTDPSKSSDEPSFGYFCLTDREICKTRTIDAEPPKPPCTATACNYFVRNGLYFTAYDHTLVMDKLAQLLQEPSRRRVDLRFDSFNVLETAYRQLKYNGGLEELLRATGRSGVENDIIDSKLNILSFFFAPLEQPQGPPKPEEARR